MDVISIRGLRIYAYHGVFSEEKKLGQHFYVDADLYTDTHKAAVADDLDQSTNYGEVCKLIQKVMTEDPCFLIEAAVERIAYQILLNFPRIREVEIRLHKPQAPISMSFEDVFVCIRRGWHTAYVAFGSNMGERSLHIEHALEALRKHKLSEVQKVSDILRTTPYGMTKQDEFLNGTLELQTLLPPYELLDLLQSIELEQGRERLVHWGPRTLDLDLLFYDDEVIDSERLTVPHIDMQNRDFVLTPLAQIAAYKRHPILNRTVGQLLEELKKNGEQHVIS